MQVRVEGLRSQSGVLRFCLTRAADYQHCDKEQAAVRLTVPASTGIVTFNGMAPGEWSLMLFHDSNANGKLDKRFGIPTEGFGFSRNPTIRFGPPQSAEVRFAVPAGLSRQDVRVRYIF